MGFFRFFVIFEMLDCSVSGWFCAYGSFLIVLLSVWGLFL